jgi:hypothetical protein
MGNYNWVALAVDGPDSLFGYMSWTDNRDVRPCVDIRETDCIDGFDVLQRRTPGRSSPTSARHTRARPEHLGPVDHAAGRLKKASVQFVSRNVIASPSRRQCPERRYQRAQGLLAEARRHPTSSSVSWCLLGGQQK